MIKFLLIDYVDIITINSDIMKKIYFTPLLEDIRKNYECEQLIKEDDDFKWVFRKLDFEGVCNICIVTTRVPYLTKEQIETEGWIAFSDNKAKGISTDYFFVIFQFLYVPRIQ